MQKMRTTLIAMIMLVSGCYDSEQQQPAKVEIRGAMRSIMQKGDLTSKARLDSLSGKPALYALGAVTNLKGEIQIFDGQPLISSVVDSQLALSQSFKHGAALLAYAEVAKWQKIDLPAELSSRDDLETFLQSEITRQPGLQQPMPFLLRGQLPMLKWHVINWVEGDSVHTHEKHRTSGLHGELREQSVEVFGFYSSEHHGILSHHTTDIHAHFKTTDANLAGHVDDLEIGPGTELFLPAR